MLIRALIVLLIVLNLGVAAWWLTRPEPPPPAAPEIPAGVARLQLVGESEVPVSGPPLAASRVAAPVQAEPSQCFSLGPFTSEASATLAQQSAQAQLLRPRLREVPGLSAQGYQVVLPPAADRDTALATAARIGAAGFNDYLVINQGELANGIALGRYRGREAAERRQAELQAAGFPARLQPVGRAGPSQWWLDAGAAAGVDLVALARTASTGTPLPMECTALR